MKNFRVFSKNFPNLDMRDVTNYMSYYECQKWIDNMAKCGRATHFYYVSSMSIDKVQERYGG